MKNIIKSNHGNRRFNISFLKSGIKREWFFSTSINKKIGNGKATQFWHNRWLSEYSLKVSYPLLFEIALDSDVIIDKVLGYNKCYLLFRRSITGTSRIQLNNLYFKLSRVNLTTHEDEII
jgi:hypothetical protein